MFDIHALIAALDTTVATRSDASSIAALLKANIDQATVPTARSGSVLINGARLDDLPGEIGTLATPTPGRRVTVVFAEPKPQYQGIRGETFGANQRIEKSKLSEGFSILFSVDTRRLGSLFPDQTASLKQSRAPPMNSAAVDVLAARL